MTNDSRPQQVDRENRYSSHALVEVRKFKLLPIGIHSAVLLDISLGGFKAEFTGEVIARPGDRFWLGIPLSPLGIYAPKRLLCRGECRWFDTKRYRIGGTFSELDQEDRRVIEQVVEMLSSKGSRVV